MLWIKHFSDARRNPKLLHVERKLGEGGYARFFKLLEIIAERGGKGANFRPEVDLTSTATDLEWLSSEIGVEEGVARETLDVFAKVGLIDEGAWKQTIVAVPAMREYADEYVTRCKKRIARSLEVDSEKKRTESRSRSRTEQNGDHPATVPTQSGHGAEGVQKMYDPTDQLIEVTGAGWRKLGIRKLSERYKPFVELVRSIKPTWDETIAQWCGRILDACSVKDISYPPEFLAITRRYREKDVPFYSAQERTAARNAALLARPKV